MGAEPPSGSAEPQNQPGADQPEQPPWHPSSPPPAGEPQSIQPDSGELPPSHPGYSTAPKREKPSAMRTLFEFLVIIVAAVLVAYLVQAFLVKPFRIPSESMENTLLVGDRVLVNRLAYAGGRTPSRGDIIVFKSPINSDEDLIKRVVAVGGDNVAWHQGNLYVNGQIVPEGYVKPGMPGPDFPNGGTPNTTVQNGVMEVAVPDGTVFVMGDNRGNSEDARFWPSPFLPDDQIIGRAFLIYWPLGRFGFLH